MTEGLITPEEEWEEQVRILTEIAESDPVIQYLYGRKRVALTEAERVQIDQEIESYYDDC